MKYHYQYVSPKSVRIELIPEDKGESTLLESLTSTAKNEIFVAELFAQPVSTYAPDTTITKINFMDYPKVALVSFEKIAVKEGSCA